MLCAQQLEFDQVAWQAHNKPEFAQSPWQYRSTCHRAPAGTALHHLIQQVESCQTALLTQLWSVPLFSRHLWAGYTLEQLITRTQPYFELCKDAPGFATDTHVDHRGAVTAGMLFFNTDADNAVSTEFYDDELGANAVSMPTAWGQGWFCANYHCSWHKGANASDRVRYSLKFGLHLRRE